MIDNQNIRIEVEQAKKFFTEHEAAYIEHCHLIAKQLMIYFQALQDKGFTQKEALQIVIGHGINPGGMK